MCSMFLLDYGHAITLPAFITFFYYIIGSYSIIGFYSDLLAALKGIQSSTIEKKNHNHPAN